MARLQPFENFRKPFPVLRNLLPTGLLFLSALRIAAQTDLHAKRESSLQLDNYQWETDARDCKLSEPQIAMLRKQGFVITDKSYPQVFTPYLDKTRIFITSDSLINGYSVLLEDSVYRFEKRNARYLETFLRAAWNGVREIDKGNTGDPALFEAACTRAKITMGVACALATGETITDPPALAKTINEEVQRVQTATGKLKPDWLGAPDSGFMTIDYTRFRPRGFYTKSPPMERYFQATEWLHAIPFRLDKDEEFATYLLLFRMFRETEDKNLAQAFRSIQLMKYGFHILVGEKDHEDPSLDRGASWADSPWNAELLARLRKSFDKDETGDTQINDQIAFPAAGGKPERSFRLLTAYRVPDAVLFAQTENSRGGNPPSGLEVAAAMGSPAAGKILGASNAKLLEQIEGEKERFHSGSIYYQFLDALAVLLQPVDSAAPALFHSPAWEMKSLQTFLGGWVQARHAWVLQAKQNYTTMGMSMAVPSGFAEPVPDFYNKMGQLAAETQQVLTDLGVYSDETAEMAEELRSSAQAWKRHVKSLESNKNAQPEGEDARLMSQGEKLLIMTSGIEEFLSRDDDPSLYPPALENLADRLEKRDFGGNLDLQINLTQQFPTGQPKWNRFMLLCFKLEALSRRQLKGLPLTREDEELATGYGEELAKVMFYEGNSYNDPADDMPRIVDIHTNPTTGRIAHSGIGRPRQIFVLYPYRGKEILTHGAVFPYYEFPNSTRLSDKEWIDLLSSPNAPSQPAWLKTLNGPN